MEKKEATIYEYARMCNKHKDCKFCPLSIDVNGMNVGCVGLLQSYPKKANEIILNWCEEHPIKTRQDKFLEMFPNTKINSDGIIMISPCTLESGETIPKNFPCSPCTDDCVECRKEYWLAEVDENNE